MPPDTEIEVERVTPAVFPVLSLILNGNVPDADLRDDAYYILRPLFSRVPGVGAIQVQATDTREVSVIVDPQKMLAHRLSLVEIADELRATNQVTSVGRLSKDYSQYLVLATSQFANLDDIRNAVVAIENGAPIRVRDLAEVRYGVGGPPHADHGNGQPAALINISRQIGGNILQIARQIKIKLRKSRLRDSQDPAHYGGVRPGGIRLGIHRQRARRHPDRRAAGRGHPVLCFCATGAPLSSPPLRCRFP